MRVLSGLSKMLAIMADGAEEIPMPSPWAAAVAVMALLGFGVLVGSAISPAAPSAGPTRVLLAAPPAAASGGTPAGQATPPSASAEPTPAPSEEEEASNESTQASEGEAKSGGKGKSSSHSGSKDKAKEKSASTEPSQSASGLPPVKHVFLIVLSEEGYQASFGAGAKAPYLSQALPKQGELIESYFAVAGGEPANGIALISGQGPTQQTVSGCQSYADLLPGSAGAEGQALGSGCVYPSTTLTLAGELSSAGKSWRAYIEGLDTSGGGTARGCLHPQIGETDTNGTGGYLTWRNPFVYFHSLIDGPTCAKDDMGIDQLRIDLTSASKTPTFSYIAPGACDDGSQTPCSPGQPAGLAPAESFLRKVVPEIERSPAYKQGGLIAVTFDHAPQTGAGADSSGCCVTSAYPNMPAASAPSATSTTPSASGALPGGGKVGLLLISKYVKPGSINLLGEYDHFSLLLSIEKLFGLNPLGYAGAKSLLAFDSSVFNAGR